MPQTSELLFVGTGRVVTAIDRFSGRPAWRVKLPRFFGGTMTLLASNTEVFVGRGGYVYCLDAATGAVLWERGLDGNGLVFMSLSGADQAQQQIAAAVAAQQAAATAAASG